MFLFLNPPRSFWQIPDTEMTLTRSEPVKNVSDLDLDELDSDQRKILDRSIQLGILSVVDENFAKRAQMTPTDQILSLSAQEIQKRHVSALIKAKDLTGLAALLEAEQKKDTPRTSVVQLFQYAINRIHTDFPEEKLLREIEVIDEVVETPQEAPATPIPQKKKGRNKPIVTEK